MIQKSEEKKLVSVLSSIEQVSENKSLKRPSIQQVCKNLAKLGPPSQYTCIILYLFYIYYTHHMRTCICCNHHHYIEKPIFSPHREDQGLIHYVFNKTDSPPMLNVWLYQRNKLHNFKKSVQYPLQFKHQLNPFKQVTYQTSYYGGICAHTLSVDHPPSYASICIWVNPTPPPTPCVCIKWTNPMSLVCFVIIIQYIHFLYMTASISSSLFQLCIYNLLRYITITHF